jgi:tetratricopeptide (TPR) repeat protein
MSAPSTGGGTRARRAARGEPAGAVTPRPTVDRSGDAGPGAITGRADEARRRRELDPDTLAALEEQRAFLLRSLEDLDREHDAGDVDDDDYEALKDDYTARAAAVIRAIDDRHAGRAAVRAPRSWGRILVGVAAVALLGLVAGILVARSSGSRAPGDVATGGIEESSRDLIRRAQQLTGEAQAALEQGDGQAAVEAYQGAIEAYDEALELQPTDVEAMTYRGWLLHNLALQAAGTAVAADLDASALEWLDRAVGTDPGYADARIFRALLYEGRGETTAALADVRAVDPGAVPAFMRSMVDGLRTRLEEGAGTAGTGPTG